MPNVRIVRNEIIGSTQYTHILIEYEHCVIVIRQIAEVSNDNQPSGETTPTQSTQTQVEDATANDIVTQSANNDAPSGEACVYNPTARPPTPNQSQKD